jgi:HPt (histidine-containing phosphotransfer) domain-containing protein
VQLRDAAAVKSAAHAIKGTVAMLSAHPTQEAAARLERMGGQGELAGIEAVAQDLEAELERFKTSAAALVGPPSQ